MSFTEGIWTEPPQPRSDVAPDWALVLTATAAILIAVLGFLGNLLTILALTYSRSLRNAATWLVVNLAVTEGIFCVTILPLSAAHLLSLQAHDRPLFTNRGCSVFVFLRYVIIQAELLSIAAIALNRCVLIAVPKKYPQVFTFKKTRVMIASIWLVSIVIMLIPMLKLYGSFEYNKDTNECDFSDNQPPHYEAPRKLFLTLGFVLPCLVIILSYSYIYFKACRSSRRMRRRCHSSVNSEPTSGSTRKAQPAEGLRARDIRIARTIGVIFLVFLVCCTPVTIAHYLHSRLHNPTLLLLLHPLYWAQYCINILVYVLMNRQYRDAYVNYLARWWPNFREMMRRRFQWNDEVTSDTRRGSRGATPGPALKFSTQPRASPAPSPALRGHPLGDTRL